MKVNCGSKKENHMKDKLPKSHPITTRFFIRHFARNCVIGIALTGVILLIGMVGYRHYEHADWIDAYANASMIISGVGTITNPKTDLGKMFVATYFLVGAAGYIFVIGIIFAPIFHWIFRQMHIADREHI
jgi:hypothetical protein